MMRLRTRFRAWRRRSWDRLRCALHFHAWVHSTLPSSEIQTRHIHEALCFPVDALRACVRCGVIDRFIVFKYAAPTNVMSGWHRYDRVSPAIVRSKMTGLAMPLDDESESEPEPEVVVTYEGVRLVGGRSMLDHTRDS